MEYFLLKLVSNNSEIFLFLHLQSAGAYEWRVCRSSHQDTDDTDTVIETFCFNSVLHKPVAQTHNYLKIVEISVLKAMFYRPKIKYYFNTAIEFQL
jgi:hypothetical protein